MLIGSVRRSLPRLVWVFAAVLAVPSAIWAQEESSSTQAPDSQSVSQTGTADGNSKQPEESWSTQSPSPAPPQGPQIRQLDKAGPLLPNPGLMRWGSLYVGSIELFQVYDSVQFAASVPEGIHRVSLLRSDIIYDRRFQRRRLAFQYRPRIAVVDGEAKYNFLDEAVNFDMYYLLSPRWTFSFADYFRYTPRRNIVAQNSLQVESLSGSTLQTNFLDSGGLWVRNDIDASFAYQSSARTVLTISPHYTDGYASNPFFSTRGQYVGARVSVAHSLTQTKTVGISYLSEFITRTRSKTSTRTTYQSVGGFYSQRLRPTWWVHASLRAVASPTNPNLRLGRWRPAGSFATVKEFGRSTVSFAYNRGHDFPGYVTDRYADRVDLAYNVRLTAKWEANLGAGYYRETGLKPLLSGKYAVSSVGYHFSPSLILFAHYGRKGQHSNTNQVLTGTRNLFVVGIRWEPSTAAR